MFSAINRLLGAGRPQASTDMLPPELQTLISAATIMERSSVDENETPRVLVATARGSFHIGDSDKHSRRFLANGWPELNESQKLRALALLNSRVLEVRREQSDRERGPSWASWTPLRGPGR